MKKSGSLFMFAAALSVLTAGVSNSPRAADAVCRVLSDPLRRLLAAVSSVFSFPLFEAGLLVLPTVLVLTCVRAVRGGNPAVLSRRATAAAGVAFSLFLVLSVLPARRIPPADPTPPPVADYFAFASSLVAGANAEEAQIPDRPGPGTPPAFGSVAELSDAVTALLRNARLTPVEPIRVKETLFPGLLARLGLLGYHAAWTGEATVTPAAPAYTLPFTAAHEAAHQAGILSEGEASFVAYRALLSSTDPSLRYAGILGALDATLPLLPADRQSEILSTLSPRVREDLSRFDGFLSSGKGAAVREGNAAAIRLRGGEEARSYDLFPILACRSFLARTGRDQADDPAIY